MLKTDILRANAGRLLWKILVRGLWCLRDEPLKREWVITESMKSKCAYRSRIRHGLTASGAVADIRLSLVSMFRALGGSKPVCTDYDSLSAIFNLGIWAEDRLVAARSAEDDNQQ